MKPNNKLAGVLFAAMVVFLGEYPSTRAQDCGLAAHMQAEWGSAVRQKIGYACPQTNGPTKYFLAQNSGTGDSDSTTYTTPKDANGYLGHSWTWERVQGSRSEMDPDRDLNGNPVTDGCGGNHLGFITSSATSYECKDGSYNWTDVTRSWHIVIRDGVTVEGQPDGSTDYPSGCLANDYRNQPGYDSATYFETNETATSCEYTGTRGTTTSSYTAAVMGYHGIPGTATFSASCKTYDGTWLSSEFTTDMLKKKVLGLAESRMSTDFVDSDAVAIRALSPDEDCATAQKAKWRIRITGTIPGQQYTVYWTEIKYYFGTVWSRRCHANVEAPDLSEWYYPSPAGLDVATPSWTPGYPWGCNNSCTYGFADIKPKSGQSPSPGSGNVTSGLSSSISGCASCGKSGSMSGGPAVGVSVSISAGSSLSGGSAGEFYISESEASLQLATPSVLQFSATTSASMGVEVLGSDYIRQVSAPQCLANVISNSPFSYSVNLYHTAAKGAWNGQTYDLVNPAANLITTWTIENPDASTSITNRLRVTQTPNGGSSTVWLYSYNNNSGQWTLSLPDGISEQRLIVTTNTSAQTWTETKQQARSGGAVEYSESRTYTTFSWGEAVATETVGIGADARTTQYTYYSDAASAGFAPSSGHVPLKSIVRPDGSWEYYVSYDAQGNPTKVLSGFDGALSTDANTCISTEYAYTLVGSDDDPTIHPETPRQETRKIKGSITSLTYRVLKSGVTTEYSCALPTMTYQQAADVNNTNKLVTVTTYFTDGDGKKGRVQSITNPDGTMSVYDYVINGSQETDTQWTGAPDGLGGVNDGTKVVTVYGTVGEVTSKTTTDIKSGIVISSESYTYLDDFKRSYTVTYLDGTKMTYNYDCCGLDNVVDRDGVTTQYYYDASKRQTAQKRLGILTTNALNSAGLVLSTTRFGTDASAMLMGQYHYNTAGVMDYSVNALGGTNTVVEAFDANRVTRTTTNPDGGTRIEKFYPNGATKSTTGTATFPVRYAIGVEQDGSIYATYTQEIKLKGDGVTDSLETVKTYTDMLGRTYKTVYADASKTPTSKSLYNAKGQLALNVDPDGVTTIYSYNAKGEQEVTATDMNGSGVIEFNGTDRITKQINDVVAAHSTQVRRTRTYVWGTNNVDVSNLVSMMEVSADGLHTWQTVYRDASTPVVTESITRYDVGGKRYVTNIAPNLSYSVSAYTSGRLDTVTRYPSDYATSGLTVTKTSYIYDTHGRQWVVNDARNGNTTFTYNAADLTDTITTPSPNGTAAPQVTTTKYNKMLQVTNIIQPDLTSVYSEYLTTNGLLRKTWGSRTYPVEYTYDPQGRMLTMKTWQNFASGSGAAVTTWNYDAWRGWLSSKKYNDNYGPSYTYYGSGRLNTRTWARGVVTTYSTNAAGEIATVSYSDSTPQVTRTYDRRGRLATVVQNGMTTSYTYNDANQALSESYSGGLLAGLMVTNSVDAQLNRATLAAKKDATQLLQVSYGFDTASRLRTVTEGTATA